MTLQIRVAGLMVLLGSPLALANDWQPLASIQAAAERYLRAQYGSHGDVTVSARTLDDRLRLTRCPNPLQADAPAGLRGGRGAVRVRCEGAKPWKLFVPVVVTRQVPVVFARRALAAGTVIGPDDLAVETRPETLLPSGFLSDADSLAGLTTRRAVSRGSPLTSRIVQAGRLVRRGQRVSLFIRSNGVFVKSDGLALADAGRNQRLSVKTRAGRVVAGIVRDAGNVEVLY